MLYPTTMTCERVGIPRSPRGINSAVPDSVTKSKVVSSAKWNKATMIDCLVYLLAEVMASTNCRRDSVPLALRSCWRKRSAARRRFALNQSAQRLRHSLKSKLLHTFFYSDNTNTTITRRRFWHATQRLRSTITRSYQVKFIILQKNCKKYWALKTTILINKHQKLCKWQKFTKENRQKANKVSVMLAATNMHNSFISSTDKLKSLASFKRSNIVNISHSASKHTVQQIVLL